MKTSRQFFWGTCGLILLSICAGANFEEVVKLVPQGPDSNKLNFQLLKDTPEMFAMVLESPQTPAKVILRPSQFQIRAGEKYWVENYFLDSFEITATSDGVLELEYPKVNYNQLMISGTSGNLLSNSSFESVNAQSAIGWQIRTTTRRLPYRDWWSGEGAGPEVALAVKGMKSSKFGGVDQTIARSGQKSLFLKQTCLNKSLVAISSPVALKPGKEYFLRGYFNLENLKFGSDPGLLIELTASGRLPEYRYALFYPRNLPANHWKEAYLRLSVPADWKLPKARVILSVSGEPFSIRWDDLDLRECPKMVFQMPKKSQIIDKASDDVIKAKLASIEPYTAKLVNHKGATALEVNGRIIPPIGYLGFLDSGHGDFADIGIDMQWIYLPAGNTGKDDWRGKKLWIADGKFDFSSLDARIAKLLRQAPNASVMLYLICDPYPAFGKVHPDAVTLDEDGQPSLMEGSGRVRTEPWHAYWYTPDSDAYRHEVCKMLKALGEYIKTSPYGKVVAGVHLAGSHDAQYFPKIYDGSQGYRRSFGKYLRKIYNNNVTALQKAWSDSTVTYENVKYPKSSEFIVPNRYFLYPANGRDRRLIDASCFREVAPVETLDMMAKSLKDAVGRPIYVSTYYNDFIAGWDLGKNDLSEVLDSKYLDGVTSVIDYAPNRLTGCPGGGTSLQGSVRLHHKLQLAEIDYRTEFSETWNPKGIGYDQLVSGSSHGIDENNAQLRRDLGQILTQQQGAWFYSLTGQGWASSQYMDNIKEGLQAAELGNKNPCIQDQGQLGVFFDEHELDYLTRTGKLPFRLAFHQICTFYLRKIFNVSGLTWDAYLLSDMEHPNRPDYRINIFPAAASLTDDQIVWIEKNLQKDGKINIFCFDAGRLAAGGFEENIKKLTGIKCVIDEKKIVNYNFKECNPTNSLSASFKYPFTDFEGPMISVKDSDATPIAYIENGKTIVAAEKKHTDWTGIYIAVPSGITPKFLREVAANVGIVPVGPEGDATYSGNGFIVIHAMSSGEKLLRWKGKCNLLDLVTGKIVAKNTESLRCEMSVGETRWFYKMPALAKQLSK